MNKERLHILADHIEGLDQDEFNMDYWKHTVMGDDGHFCHSVGCIAGWAVTIFDDADPFASYKRSAAKVLALWDDVAWQLFAPNLRTYDNIRTFDAAVVLRLVADGMDPEAAWHQQMEADKPR